MGLSSSQARLLSLTSRQHDIEYKAQHLEAQKLQMANESTQVYQEYENALNSSKVQYKTVGADGSATFVDATYNNFIGSNAGTNSVYALRRATDGALYVSDEVKRAYNCSNKTVQGFLTTLNSIKSNASASYTSITTEAQLRALNYHSGHYRLDNDLTVSNWSGISNFYGTFDGNGHTITITSGTQGLFASTNGANIKNVNVDANINSGSINVGALIGLSSNSTIENCSASGSVSASKVVGGLIGSMSGSTIKNCNSSADVASTFVAPGNVAKNHWDTDCIAGGLIGYCGDTQNIISDSVSTGDVSVQYWLAGGFFGAGGNVIINNCSSYGNVTINKDGYANTVTDPSGRNTGDGGAFSSIYVGTITNSNAYGTISTGGDGEHSKLFGFVAGANGGSGSAIVNGCYTSSTETFSSPSVTVSNTKTSPNIFGTNTDAASYPNLDENMIQNYIGIFNQIQAAGGECLTVSTEMSNSKTWFTNMISSGNAIISVMSSEANGTYSFKDTNVATDTNLQEVSDDTQLKKAEAKYEADMRKIDAKDKKFDTDLAALETERNAIKTEVETLKTVAKDNVDRTFKLFS